MRSVRTWAEKLEMVQAAVDTENKARTSKGRPPLPEDCQIMGYLSYVRRMADEEAELLRLPVPKAFTLEKPDTDLSRAARRQVEITKGIPPTSGLQKNL
jgi:hypothetical protein